MGSVHVEGCDKGNVSLYASPLSLHGSRLVELLVKDTAPIDGPLFLFHNFSLNPHLEFHGKFLVIRREKNTGQLYINLQAQLT